MCFQETNVDKCHHLGNETFKKKQLENMVQHTTGTMIFATLHPSLTLPSKKIKSSPKESPLPNVPTCSNCICGTKAVYPKKTPPKTNMTMERQPFGGVSPIKNGVSFRGCTSTTNIFMFNQMKRSWSRDLVRF